jgi:hypothetical protein
MPTFDMPSLFPLHLPPSPRPKPHNSLPSRTEFAGSFLVERECQLMVAWKMQLRHHWFAVMQKTMLLLTAVWVAGELRTS